MAWILHIETSASDSVFICNLPWWTFCLINHFKSVQVKLEGEIGDLTVNIIIPGVFHLLLALALMLGGSSLINRLVEEEKNRLTEILLSSNSVRQLLSNFPNSPIWIVLRIFPITAPIQTMLR